MEAVAGIQGTGNVTEANSAGVEIYTQRLDEIIQKVDQFEKQVKEIEEFFSNLSKKQLNAPKGCSSVRDRDKGRQVSNLKKQHQDAEIWEAAAAKRRQDHMRQFRVIFDQITHHKCAKPFMEPVDVEGLGLHDYYEIIEEPMDFTTIKNRMEAKDGTGYKNVQEICDDMRLVFKNAIKYNGEQHDVSIMAKTLLKKFEEKWNKLLHKITVEEVRQQEEEAQARLQPELAQETAHAKMAREISNELNQVDIHLDELREMVVQKCRKMTTGEKRKLGEALARLPHDDLNKALEIVAENHPIFQGSAEEVDLDMDALNESTLWRLKFFVRDALEFQGNSPAGMGGNITGSITNTATNDAATNGNNIKRKRDLGDSLAKTAKRNCRKASP